MVGFAKGVERVEQGLKPLGVVREQDQVVGIEQHAHPPPALKAGAHLGGALNQEGLDPVNKYAKEQRRQGVTLAHATRAVEG